MSVTLRLLLLASGRITASPLQCEIPLSSVSSFPIGATFAFKSRTNFSSNFVLDLSTKIRDLSAVTMQLNPGKSLRIKKRQSGI
jgi:hypothetical protein